MGLSLFLCAACWGGVEERAATEVTDSAGIQVVTNHAPRWARDRGWRLSPGPLLDLSLSGDGSAHEFYLVEGGSVLSTGEIVVADAGSSEIRVFSSEGRFLQRVGRNGEGPGEYRRISSLTRLPGDTLLVFDEELQRITRLGPGGEVHLITRLENPENRTFQRVLPVFDGRVVGVRSMPNQAISSVLEGLRVTDATYLLFSREGSFQEPLTTAPGDQLYFTRPRPGQAYFSFRVPLFGSFETSAVFEERLFVPTGSGYEIAEHDLAGRPVRLIRRAGVDLSLAANEVDSVATARLAVGGEVVRYNLPYPSQRPPFGRLLSDARGNLWVSVYSQYLEDPQQWSVFSPEGHLLCEVAVPPRFRLLEVGDNYVLGRVKDEMDVERVQLYSLVKTSR